MTRIDLENGKYSLVHDNGANLRALRHGEPWRDLAGDGLVLAAAQEIEGLRAQLSGKANCAPAPGIHVVLDLETLGTGDNAAVASIGAAIVGGPSRVWRIDIKEAQANGGTVTQSTLDWWAKQCPEAREELTGTLTTQQAVAQLTEWAMANGWDRNSTIWGKGPSFDCVILRNAMQRAWVAPFWMFWQERCVRTILQMVPEANRLPFEGTPHRAEDDARHEARQVEMALRKVGVL